MNLYFKIGEQFYSLYAIDDTVKIPEGTTEISEEEFLEYISPKREKKNNSKK